MDVAATGALPMGLALPDQVGTSVAATQPVPLPQARRIGPEGRYRISHRIGEGGFAQTYLAYDTRLFEAPCVVKQLVLPPDDTHRDERLATLEREARLLVQLKTPGHPNIPEIYEYLAEVRCLVMKYVQGQSLGAILRERRAGLPEASVLGYAHSICSALVYMHTYDVLHLDLKPDNVLYDADTDHLWVIDFGIGRHLRGLTGSGRSDVGNSASGATLPAFGSPRYAPPEQWAGRPTPASDVYALAATMWSLLTREPPGLDGSLPLRGATVSPALHRLIALGLARDQADRPTAYEFLGELETLITPEPIALPLAPAPPPLAGDPVGRTDELAALEQQLRTEHTAVVTGIAGVGKTTLGAMLAARWSDRRRIFWHSFQAEEGGALLVSRLAGFLATHGYGNLWRLHQRVTDGQDAEQIARLRCDYAVEAVSNRRFLLVLDDLHLVEDDPIIQRLIAGLRRGWQRGEGGLVLISRHVPPLDLKLSATQALQGLTRTEAELLLAARGLSLDAGLVEQLYRITEGNGQLLTLAIDALHAASAPARLIERLVEAHNIERFLLNEVDRQLGAQERSALAAAALLGAGGSRKALAAAVGQALPRELLHDLVRRHLLMASGFDGAQEYRLHAIMQPFYYDELETGRRREMHRCAAEHYEHAEPRPLLAARHYARAGEASRAVAVATRDTWTLINTGQTRLLATLLDEIATATLSDEQRVQLQLARGDVLTVLREGATAREAYQTVISAEGPEEPWRLSSFASACRGMAASLEYEDPDEALSWLQRGLEALPAAIADEDGASSIERARLQHRRSSVLLGRGEAEEARTTLIEALATVSAGDERLRADILVNLGVACCQQGDTAEGEAHFRSALASYERLGHSWGRASALHNLGLIACYSGDLEAATATLAEALSLAVRVGDVNRMTSLRLSLGILATQRGSFAEARLTLLEALNLAGRHDLTEYLVAAGASLTDLYLQTGSLEEAAVALAEAELVAASFDAGDQGAELARLGASLALARGDLAGATAKVNQALALAAGDPREEGLALRVRGQVALASGNLAAGLTDLDASAALLDDTDPYEAARTREMWKVISKNLEDSGQEVIEA